MNRVDLEKMIIELISGFLGSATEVRLESQIVEDLHIESTDLIDLVMQIEESISGLYIPDNSEFKTVNELITLIEKQIS